MKKEVWNSILDILSTYRNGIHFNAIVDQMKHKCSRDTVHKYLTMMVREGIVEKESNNIPGKKVYYKLVKHDALESYKISMIEESLNPYIDMARTIMKYNNDPFSKYSNDEIVKALLDEFARRVLSLIASISELEYIDVKQASLSFISDKVIEFKNILKIDLHHESLFERYGIR